MGSFFDTHFSRTAVSHLLRLYGETVTFYPDGQASGVERTAIVVRDPLRVMEELGRQVGPGFVVKFKDDATEGILESDASAEFSRVEVPDQVGETPTIRQVAQVLSKTAGWVRLYVQ